MDRQTIERYAAGATVPADAIRGLSAADLDATPIPGTWSIRQIVVHLMDSDLVGSDRMKRVIAMDNPSLLAFDENRYVERLAYSTTDVAVAADLFRLNRLVTADILRRLPDDAFGRAGVHSERGRLTLADLVAGFVGHLEHHMAFVRKKRGLLGKP